MYPLHKNDTGSFQELAHAADVKFGQLSLLTIEPMCWRGNHYHKRKREWFCCLHGRCEITTVDITTGASRSIVMGEDNREFVEVVPNELHKVFNVSGVQVCEILIIVSEEFDPEDPDTYKGKYE